MVLDNDNVVDLRDAFSRKSFENTLARSTKIIYDKESTDNVFNYLSLSTAIPQERRTSEIIFKDEFNVSSNFMSRNLYFPDSSRLTPIISFVPLSLEDIFELDSNHNLKFIHQPKFPDFGEVALFPEFSKEPKNVRKINLIRQFRVISNQFHVNSIRNDFLYNLMFEATYSFDISKRLYVLDENAKLPKNLNGREFEFFQFFQNELYSPAQLKINLFYK